MKLFADYHTHTTYSDGHGKVEENIQAAVNKGLQEIAITDHGPRNIGTGVKNPETFLAIKEEVKSIANTYPQIKVKVGAEADITGVDGHIDIPEHIIKELDLLIVGLHPYIWPDSLGDAWELVIKNQLAKVNRRVADKVKNTNTKALIAALDRYPVTIISHPDLQMHIDVGEVAKACARAETAFEINTGHSHYLSLELVQQAAREGVCFSIDSDAHFPETVGNLDIGRQLAEKAGLSPEQVINAVK
ncbi:MAG: PHP domain-containing protein [Desulfitobacterium hafniense]|nr:PHP domain-containing protein [Desulfitobacterium hafniense]